ncbi:MAG: N-acetyl-gamma-glutamyl-phosphate reductase [Pseudomonadota bacterium]|nr:N-acetyl-gamma-glutamyl-phosphate reductase [Pseudomonadota bacterium]
MIKVGIVGGTGYTGAELLRLLARHPYARVEHLTSRKEAGKPVTEMFPQLRGFFDGLAFTAPDIAALAGCDAVFFATPHTTAMQMAPELVSRGVRVVDLSADFRLRDAAVYKQWYGHAHACPDLLEAAVYGLPEIKREHIRRASVVGNPGCYPTAVQLGFLPLLEAQAVDAASLIADCKSGVSGAGRELKLGSLFAEATDSFKAYGVAGHRHLPEIEQGLVGIAGPAVSLTFTPHLVPMVRGIHATLYARVKKGDLDYQALFEARYRDEPFVDVMPAGAAPDTRSVRASNTCRIAVHRPMGRDTVVVLAVIDNLVKGAAGQAVQNFNLMFGFDEVTALDQPPVWP